MATDTKHEESSHQVAVKPSKEVSIQFGPVTIQTAEDAAIAFLREEISEEDFRAACAKFGVLPGTLLQAGKNERLDAAFQRKIPDDIYNAPVAPDVTLEDKLKSVSEKEKAKKEATAADEGTVEKK